LLFPRIRSGLLRPPTWSTVTTAARSRANTAHATCRSSTSSCASNRDFSRESQARCDFCHGFQPPRAV